MSSLQKLQTQSVFDSLAPLTEARIDNFHFQVTWNPLESGSCILWLRDLSLPDASFNALGKFKSFDKRKALEFVVKYATNPALRAEMEERRFELRVKSLPLASLRSLAALSRSSREAAYRSLFALDGEELAPESLSRRRRSMTRRFHPDAGGDDQAMALINSAYDYLLRQRVRRD